MTDFWHSADTHVACAPGGHAEGLREFVDGTLGPRGWCLFQTSGTEGAPKWVALTKEALLVSARAVNAHYGVTPEDRWLLALPRWHVGGFGIVARAFAAGNTFETLPGKWHAEAFAALAARTQATLASLVPAQVFDLVAARITAPASLRAVLVGGAALGAEVAAAARALGWPLRRTYGMTETCSQVASQRVEDGDMEVLPIWDLHTGPDGVLTVKGPALARGYVSPAAAGWRWEPLSAENGLRTRDRVTLTTDGPRRLLRFTSRAAGQVKILGELVSLGSLQETLDTLRLRLGLPTGDAAVCDLPDARAEARLVLAVSGISRADAERLQSAFNESLRPFERVSRVLPLARIPRSDLGKVRLDDLRADACSSACSSAPTSR